MLLVFFFSKFEHSIRQQASVKRHVRKVSLTRWPLKHESLFSKLKGSEGTFSVLYSDIKLGKQISWRVNQKESNSIHIEIRFGPIRIWIELTRIRIEFRSTLGLVYHISNIDQSFDRVISLHKIVESNLHYESENVFSWKASFSDFIDRLHHIKTQEFDQSRIYTVFSANMLLRISLL